MLDKLINEYNSSYHSTIKRAPCEVNEKNESEIKNLINPSNAVTKKPLFKVGDSVRISKAKHLFEKGYKFNWSEELFKIKKILATTPVTYHLEDLNAQEVKGCFYNEELLKTKIPDFARIEKVIRTKTENGKTYLRVKWKGYDNKFNSWILKDDSITLN